MMLSVIFSFVACWQWRIRSSLRLTPSLRNKAWLYNIRTVLITGNNLLTAVAMAGNSGMVASHHRVIVIKANKGGGVVCPTLSYHLSGTDGVNQSLLCASTF